MSASTKKIKLSVSIHNSILFPCRFECILKIVSQFIEQMSKNDGVEMDWKNRVHAKNIMCGVLKFIIPLVTNVIILIRTYLK